jgi:CrcB protein
MGHYILIFLGCGMGGLSRYWLSTTVHLLLGQRFPYGTLIVNVTGSFLMGLLFVLALNRFHTFAPQLRAFLLIGFLGGYTTFSSFSLETMHLFLQGEIIKPTLNIALSVILCLIATGIGIVLGRQ